MHSFWGAHQDHPFWHECEPRGRLERASRLELSPGESNGKAAVVVAPLTIATAMRRDLSIVLVAGVVWPTRRWWVVSLVDVEC